MTFISCINLPSSSLSTCHPPFSSSFPPTFSKVAFLPFRPSAYLPCFPTFFRPLDFSFPLPTYNSQPHIQLYTLPNHSSIPSRDTIPPFSLTLFSHFPSLSDSHLFSLNPFRLPVTRARIKDLSSLIALHRRQSFSPDDDFFFF